MTAKMLCATLRATRSALTSDQIADAADRAADMIERTGAALRPTIDTKQIVHSGTIS